MWFDLYLYHQVSWWTTHTCVSLLRYAQIHSIVDAFWDVYGLFDLHMLGSFASTRHTWVSYNKTRAITIAAYLLDHEWALANLLEPSSRTSATFTLACSRFCSGTLASTTNISAAKRHLFLSSIYRIHKINLCRDYYVFTPLCSLLSTTTSSLSLVSAKKLLEFFKDISEWVLATLLSLESSSSKLIVKPFKARESLRSLTKSAEWVLLSLLLFVTSHACLIVNPLFLIIAKCLIRFIDLCKLFLRALTLIHIWMKLLGPFEIRLLYVGLLCSPIDAQNGVIILLTASSVERERCPESMVFGAE